MRTRRKGRWLPKQPRLGAGMCQGTFFLSYRKLRFYTIKTLREDAHFGGVELCRLRDPPQAENPAKQDSIFYDRNLGSLESERKDQIDGTKYNL